MDDTAEASGYQKIYQDLLGQLRDADIADLAGRLELPLTPAGEAIIPFFGADYLLAGDGVRRRDDRPLADVTGAALVRYLLTGGRARPAGEFVTFAKLAGPLFGQGGYSVSALEQPIAKRFQGRTPELQQVAQSIGARSDGVGGLGSISLVFDLLPHINLQLIFYDRDDEFPARATLLFDANATRLLDFETLAVLVTVFVKLLTRR